MSKIAIYKTKNLTGDPLFKNMLVAKFINGVMHSGKKKLAQNIVYQAFSTITKKGHDPLKIFQDAIENVSPRLEVRSKRVGGAAYQVPTEVRGNRKNSLAFRWIINAARKRPNKDYHTFVEKLSAELIDAAKGEGEAIKRKNTSHKMAEANRVFSHFRW